MIRAIVRRQTLVHTIMPLTTLLIFLSFLTFSFAEAQQPTKISKIAYLVAGSASSISTYIDAFRQGLRESGYVDGKNLAIELRYADGIESRLPQLATELVRRNPDVMFTGNTAASFALKNATATIPIVVVLTGDPVAMGLVESLARPGGNVTGLTRLSNSPEITGKRLEMLKEAFPAIKLIAVLRNPASPSAAPVFKEMEAVAQSLHVYLYPVEIRTPNDFENAFSTITKSRATLSWC